MILLCEFLFFLFVRRVFFLGSCEDLRRFGKCFVMVRFCIYKWGNLMLRSEFFFIRFDNLEGKL